MANPDIGIVRPYKGETVTAPKITEAELKDIESMKAAALAQTQKQEANAQQAINEKNIMVRENASKFNDNEAEILRQIARAENGESPQQEIIKGNVFYILVSASLDDKELLDIMEMAADKENVVLVVQGVKDKKTLVDEVKHWHELIKTSGKKINFQIDPNIFIKYRAQTVPTIIHEKNGEMVAVVRGISNTTFLDGKQGDLGTQGPAKSIAERNMLDLIKEGIDNLDFEKMKKEAVERYWKNQKIYPFPVAIEDSVHYVDPSVVIPEDIVSPDGKVIAKKGLVNPMDVIPFDLKLIFFNPNSEWQRHFAKAQYASAKEQQLVPILIATDVYEDGWKTFEDSGFYGDDATLFFIQEGMRERFGVEKVPSVVTGDGKQFVINEYAAPAAE
ncbi:TrbC family F-type conjugative pilus assembly protein [Xenorhabdus sp. TH1]|uniref:TrbC family F-type conjugative pilus assembly protein n=1 Tax=Xenorhabdus sp. TH1 TaxID=3130166 RepID=UPI0030D0B4E1